jgi:CcmD family protein
MMTKLTTAIAVLLLLVFAPLRAQQPPATPDKPAAAQDEYRPVTEPIDPQDTMPAPRLVAIAYGFIWIVLFAYLWSVRSRLASVEREIETVSRRVGAGRK